MKDLNTLLCIEFLSHWTKSYPPTDNDYAKWKEEYMKQQKEENIRQDIANNYSNPISEDDWETTIWHKTPGGGDHSVAYYYDKDNNRCQRKNAVRMNIVEYKGSERINEMYGVIT